MGDDTFWDVQRDEYIISSGTEEGRKLAKDLYPYLVERDTAAILAKARSTVRDKFERLRDSKGTIYYHPGRSNLPEHVETGYVNNFVRGYFDRLAELDKEAGKQPAILAGATSTLQGVTVMLVAIDRQPDEVIYTLEIVDPKEGDTPTNPTQAEVHRLIS